ncbi:MAG: DUF2141 domain-containing protein [Capsulimonadales bacterium]|nr:DUF2141 domain-containing protein [Capsulimonadales bacterium]
MPDYRAPYLLLLALLLPGSDTPKEAIRAGTHDLSIGESGKTGFVLHIPPNFEPDRPAPLVLVLTSEKRSAGELLRKTGWENLSDRIGFAVVGGRIDPDDSPLDPERLITAVGERVTIDPARLFLVTDRRAFSVTTTAKRVTAVSCIGPGEPPPSSEATFALDVREEARDPRPVWRFFETHPRLSGPARNSTLTLLCTGLRNDRGEVLLSLFREGDGFPSDEKKAYRTAVVPVLNATATVAFPDLPPGDYAAAFVHDENRSGSFDTSFGYPLEGFGASSNPKVRLGPPRYEDARFALIGDRPETRLVLRAVYP